jgi:DNA polymerase III gamma/tau subunit
MEKRMMIPLISRYRPQTWDEVVGNKALIASLVPLLERGDSHAFLLTGASGCGKTTIARLCAMELNAGEVIEIDAATNNGVDDMRDLINSTNYQSLKGGARIIIIDEAQSITAQAWRALLKSVEEPPDWLYWIFCTTEPGKVPAQIKTRCTTYQVSELSFSQIVTELLRPVCISERREVSDQILFLCADMAEGSPRKALALLAQVIDCQDFAEARAIIQHAEIEDSPTIQLARMLVKRGARWSEVCGILNDLTNENPEGIRKTLESYITKVILNSISESVAQDLTPLLNMLTIPIYGNNIAPIVVISSRWILKNEVIR